MARTNNSLTSSLEQLEETLAPYFTDKAPFQLPQGVRDFIVMVMPWFMLIGVLVSVPAILSVVGLGTLVTPFAWMGGANLSTYWLATLFSVVILALEVIAIPRLLKKQKSGWNFAFYSSLVSIVYGVFYQSLIGILISTLICWYLLFQVRSAYKD